LIGLPIKYDEEPLPVPRIVPKQS